MPLGRFLSVDPAKESIDPNQPQTWNRYTYAGNNPLRYVDPDGRAKTEWFVKTVKGIYRRATRAQAIRKAPEGSHAVKVRGPKASHDAKVAGNEAFPDDTVYRDGPHALKRQERGDPERIEHWQPEKASGGQIGYEVVKALIGLIPTIGAATDAEAANAADETAFGARFASQAQSLFDKPIEDLTDEERREVFRALEDETNPPR
ncbi:MAG TPA: RHS repeat-associated core domain-containing protein [Thermoanaerobaculia bacterium]|nr:RHS repeat-associated core domain-containing protein [Thermoanaerobaculia bacterium]